MYNHKIVLAALLAGEIAAAGLIPVRRDVVTVTNTHFVTTTIPWTTATAQETKLAGIKTLEDDKPEPTETPSPPIEPKINNNELAGQLRYPEPLQGSADIDALDNEAGDEKPVAVGISYSDDLESDKLEKRRGPRYRNLKLSSKESVTAAWRKQGLSEAAIKSMHRWRDAWIKSGGRLRPGMKRDLSEIEQGEALAAEEMEAGDLLNAALTPRAVKKTSDEELAARMRKIGFSEELIEALLHWRDSRAKAGKLGWTGSNKRDLPETDEDEALAALLRLGQEGWE